MKDFIKKSLSFAFSKQFFRKNWTFFFGVFLISFVGGLFFFSEAVSEEKKPAKKEFYRSSYLDDFQFSQIPILHSGRVKPLSTFSREWLLVLYEKSRLPDLSAEQWLMEVLFDPQGSSERPLFKIRNPEVVDLLSIKKRDKNVYSFSELSKALDSVLDQLEQIKNKKEEERSLTENQLFDLYIKVLSYFQLKQSLALILPLFSMPPTLAKELRMNSDSTYSYLELVPFQQKIIRKIKKLKIVSFEKLSEEKQKLILLSYSIDTLSKNENNGLFKIIPPLWNDNETLWHSPWEVIAKGKGSPVSAAYLESWIEMEGAWRKGKNIKITGKKVYKKAIEISKGFASPTLLFLEKIFNDIQFFKKSLVFYILSFLLLLFSFTFSPLLKWQTPIVPGLKKNILKSFESISIRDLLYRLSFVILILGFAFHFIGILFRMVIMQRPPVSTLYESILFVSLVSVGLSLWMEKQRKGGEGLVIGTVVGSLLHFIGLKYQGTESMNLLVPVLNTNFWLATHVTCITIGYGVAIVASLMGHIYVLVKCFKGKNLDVLHKNMQFGVFLALFFCLFGTVLGGIWADQSWGRFWGWDPKENGALAIVIWLLVLIHGRLSGLLGNNSYAMGVILTNVIVAFSWFGVNLLNIGLHSYGFTSGAFWNLIYFSGMEFLLVLMAFLRLKLKNQW